ncbi:MAG: hypothetical protein ACKPKO_33730, partial [Candidatus Fonsibacter sp.]
MYECSEHVYVDWCAEHPVRKPEINFEYLVQRNAAVESGRTKLRACIWLTEVKMAIATSTVRKADDI